MLAVTREVPTKELTIFNIRGSKYEKAIDLVERFENRFGDTKDSYEQWYVRALMNATQQTVLAAMYETVMAKDDD